MNNFYIVAHQAGAENHAIPTWANSDSNPAVLSAETRTVERREIDAVPGAFQLLNLLSAEECERIIELSETLGYLEDAAVSLPRSIRHNDSFTWVVDDFSNEIIWQRCRKLMHDAHDFNAAKPALGLNSRYRFYRYGPGDYFAPHTDGSWPGSRIIDGELIDNAYADRWSQFTLLLFLSDDYRGGATRFHIGDRGNPGTDAHVDLRTPRGGALCFPHGLHPQHCLHSSTKILSGRKYIIRTDVLFGL